MTILKNVEIWHAKMDPKRPNASFNKKNPTWELQIRTSDPEQKKEWEANHLKPKLMVHKEGSPNEGEAILNAAGLKQYRVNLKKKSLKKDGTAATPVEVVNGALTPVDPNTIGNGSIAHIRIFQYDYKNDEKSGIASVLMGIQLKRHILYTPKPNDGFGTEESETITPEANDDDETDTGTAAASPTAGNSPSVSPGAPVKSVADSRPESEF